MQYATVLITWMINAREMDPLCHLAITFSLWFEPMMNLVETMKVDSTPAEYCNRKCFPWFHENFHSSSAHASPGLRLEEEPAVLKSHLKHDHGLSQFQQSSSRAGYNLLDIYCVATADKLGSCIRAHSFRLR